MNHRTAANPQGWPQSPGRIGWRPFAQCYFAIFPMKDYRGGAGAPAVDGDPVGSLDVTPAQYLIVEATAPSRGRGGNSTRPRAA